jgi:hypothetical protein
MNKRWTTLAAEFVLIIVGILVALAIDGWVADRQDRERERAFLLLLVRDLIQIEQSMTRLIAFESQLARNASRAYEIVDAGVMESTIEELDDILGRLGSRLTVFVQSPAYDDLVSTGSLHLIRDSMLRDRLLQYFNDAERTERVMEKNNNYFIDEGYYRFAATERIGARVVSIDFGDRERWEGRLRQYLNPAMLDPPLDALRRPADDPMWQDLKYRLIWRGFHSVNAIDSAEELLERSRELRNTIKDKLEGEA